MLCLKVVCTHGNTTENISSSQMPGEAQTSYTEFNTDTSLACMGSQLLKT